MWSRLEELRCLRVGILRIPPGTWICAEKVFAKVSTRDMLPYKCQAKDLSSNRQNKQGCSKS